MIGVNDAAIEEAGRSAVSKSEVSVARSDVVSRRMIAGAAMTATMRVGRGEGIVRSDERHHDPAHVVSVGPPKKMQEQLAEEQEEEEEQVEERRAAHQAQRHHG